MTTSSRLDPRPGTRRDREAGIGGEGTDTGRGPPGLQEGTTVTTLAGTRALATSNPRTRPMDSLDEDFSQIIQNVPYEVIIFKPSS